MAEASSAWRPRGAFEGIVVAGRHGRASAEPGMRAVAREKLGLATIIARHGEAEALGAALSEAYGITPPRTPGAIGGGDLVLVWSGPDQWLAVGAERGIARRLAESLTGLAAVSDQSDARAVLRLAGPRVREALAKGCPIDLHPRAFGPGSAALTAIAYMGVQLWQVDDAPTYDLAVSRSMAGSFWSWLTASAAEFGLAVDPEERAA